MSIAVAVSLVAVPVLNAPVSAATADTVNEPELIARKLVTSPQTSGPPGLSAPYNLLPWGLDRIDQRSNTLDQSYSFSKTGAGVKVYIIDSGVNATHAEAFGQRVVDGWSYRSNSAALLSRSAGVARGSIGVCTSYDQPSVPDLSDKGKVDYDGHGTHVAGIAGGQFTGVAKDVIIVPVRVLDSCGVGTEGMVREGLDWVLSNHLDGEPAVVNMSIGFEASAASIELRINRLLAEGVVVVAAAGNDGESSCNTTPAGTLGTISVGAIDSSSAEATFTNFGQCVDIFAPGIGIVSAWPQSTYQLRSGTSMAAPFVAGAVALYLQGKTATSNTPLDAWTWLKMNSTCDVVTYFNQAARAGLARTPNRLLNIGSSALPACRPESASAIAGSMTAAVSWVEPIASNGSPVTQYTVTATPGGASCSSSSALACTLTGLTNGVTYTVSVTAANAAGVSTAVTTTVTPIGMPQSVLNPTTTTGDKAVTVSWTKPSGDGDGVTYLVTTTPGGGTCSTTSTSCVINWLINSQEYTFSIVGTNQYGSGNAVTVTGTPDGPPAVPTALESTVGSRSLTVSWPAVTTTANVTYVAIANPGNIKCTTTQTMCMFVGLTNGIDYTVSISTVAPSGKVTAASSKYVARPGFTVLNTSVERRSRTTLKEIVKSVSPGRRTWSETGPCTIARGKLVAPNSKGVCKLRLRVAKSGKFPAMSTVVVVTVP